MDLKTVKLNSLTLGEL